MVQFDLQKENVTDTDKTHVYIGDTPYHLLIALVKTILSNRIGKNIFIVLDNSYSPHIIEEAKNVFKDVICHFSRIGILKNLFLLKIRQKIPFLKIGENSNLYNFHFEQKEIFVFNDNSYLGCWLNITKTPYTLIEDGLNCFKFKAHKSKKMKVYDFMYKLFGISWGYLGESKYTKAIEVNENKNIRIKHNNIIVKNRAEMFRQLSNENINLIARVFNYQPLNIKVDGEKTLLLTQPLTEDGDATHATKVDIYKFLVEKYAVGTLYIKMHPRENEDYTKIFPNAIVIGNQKLPFELYQLKENFHFTRVITTYSTAIDAVFCADEKISMTPEWVRSFKKQPNEGFS